MSWTNGFRDLSVSRLVKYSTPADLGDHGTKAWYPLGAIGLDSPPSQGADDELLQAFDRLVAIHDAYMSAECASYSSYCEAIPALEYYCGVIRCATDFQYGKEQTTSIPFLLAPQVWTEKRYKNQKTGKIVSATETSRPSVQGLYCRYGLVVSYFDDSNAAATTFAHELIHFMADAMADVGQSMYGSDAAVQREEFITHLVCDQFEKLKNALTLELTGVQIKETAEKSRMCWDEEEDNLLRLTKLRYPVLSDVSLRGKALVGDSRQLNLFDVDREGLMREVFYSKGGKCSDMSTFYKPKGCSGVPANGVSSPSTPAIQQNKKGNKSHG